METKEGTTDPKSADKDNVKDTDDLKKDDQQDATQKQPEDSKVAPDNTETKSDSTVEGNKKNKDRRLNTDHDATAAVDDNKRALAEDEKGTN